MVLIFLLRSESALLLSGICPSPFLPGTVQCGFPPALHPLNAGSGMRMQGGQRARSVPSLKAL
jgi:hypothetical protein